MPEAITIGTETTKRPIALLSADAKALHERLLKVAVGELVGYDALTAEIGRDVRKLGYGALQTARRRVLKQKQYVFGTVVNEGLRRLNDVEKVGLGEDGRRRMRRLARRTQLLVSAVDDFDALPEHVKIQHHAHMSLQGAAYSMFSTASVKKVSEHVGANGALPMGKTLKIFLE